MKRIQNDLDLNKIEILSIKVLLFTFTSLFPITKLVCGYSYRNFAIVGKELFYLSIFKYPWLHPRWGIESCAPPGK